MINSRNLGCSGTQLAWLSLALDSSLTTFGKWLDLHVVFSLVMSMQWFISCLEKLGFSCVSSWPLSSLFRSFVASLALPKYHLESFQYLFRLLRLVLVRALLVAAGWRQSKSWMLAPTMQKESPERQKIFLRFHWIFAGKSAVSLARWRKMRKVVHGFYEGHLDGGKSELMELSLASGSEMSSWWHKASACAV